MSKCRRRRNKRKRVTNTIVTEEYYEHLIDVLKLRTYTDFILNECKNYEVVKLAVLERQMSVLSMINSNYHKGGVIDDTLHDEVFKEIEMWNSEMIHVNSYTMQLITDLSEKLGVDFNNLEN